MVKKTLLLSSGGLIFLIGMITFPMPVPIGLPLMIIGMTIMLRTSPTARKKFIKLARRNPHTHKVWRRARSYRKRQ